MIRLWSDQDDETLRVLWGSVPVAEIGVALGRTRNSVLGRKFRLVRDGQWDRPGLDPNITYRKVPGLLVPMPDPLYFHFGLRRDACPTRM
jgi:hypothetical protein